MNRRASFLAAAALTIGIVTGAAFDRALIAQQTGLTRKVLLTTDEPGSTTHQLVLAEVMLQPGASAGKHRHPGIEIGYVAEGSIELKYEDGKSLTVNAGESFRNEGVHDGINHGTKPVKLIAVYAVEKGKPVTEAVQ
jgi:quercetin dioxygenase-like cupin family protein